MAGTLERSVVRVEGKDDMHTLVHLLLRHGIDYDTKPWPPQFPEFKESDSIEKMLQGMTTAIELSAGRTIGFVLDADSPLDDRWRAVRDRLQQVAVAAPTSPPPEGFVGESPKYRARVGVWLMPDNCHDGKLETLLSTLVEEGDSLIGHAEQATYGAKDLGARFSEPDTIKAILHAWLAWQEEPGCPYGTAIRARYFRHDSPAAIGFVAWFRKVFRIE